MKLPRLLLFVLVGAVAARGSVVQDVVAIDSPQKADTYVWSNWARQRDQHDITITLAPGTVGVGEFLGFAVRNALEPITAAALEKDYWEYWRRGQPVSPVWSSDHSIRVRVPPGDLPNTYIALSFGSKSRGGPNERVYCIPLTILQQAWRSTRLETHRIAAPNAPSDALRAQLFAPAVPFPKFF